MTLPGGRTTGHISVLAHLSALRASWIQTYTDTDSI